MKPGRARAPAEKPANFVEPWKKLFAYMGGYRFAIAVAIVAAVLGTVLTVIGPDYLSDMTDVIQEGLNPGMDVNIERVTELGTLLLIIYIVSGLLMFAESYVMATVTAKVAGNLRSDLSTKINRLPLSYFDKTTTGDVMSRATNDVDTIGQSMSQSISLIISSVALFVGSVVMMAITDLSMTAAAILSTIFGFVLMAFIMSRSQKYFSRQQKHLGEINGHVEEVYAGHNVVKVFNGEKWASEKFDGINEDLFKSAFKSQFLSGLMMPLMGFIGNIGYVAVCLVGAILYIDGTISFGVIIAFMVYVRLFTESLTQIAQAATSMQSVAAASDRVFHFLDEPEAKDEGEKTVLKCAKGDVEFRDVHFGYSQDKEIIHGFSAKIHAGEKVAIVGPTGAGKTTIVNLLMRFYETDSGDITIDGISTKDLTRENVHDLFCMVLQDTWLFEGTVRENIAYCKDGISDDEITEACKSVGVHHFISTLPKGYDTVLDDKTSLSAGQKQQITIARAMIEDAPLLILDEATSSVDTRTERHIQESMDKLAAGRTSFIIAHRLSTIKNADMILVMKDGNIIESGKHDELLACGGFYSQLYNSQFEDVEAD